MNVPKMSECAQNVRVHPVWMCPKCLCAQCKCAQNVRVRPMWICPKCQSAPKMSECLQCESTHIFWVVISAPKFLECAQGEWASAGAVFGCLFLCPNFQSAPKVNVPMLAHFLGGYFYTQSFRVIPQCQSAPNMNASKMSECA